MSKQTLTKQTIQISHAKGVLSTFEPVEIAIENQYECILNINNRFVILRQEGIALGLKTSMHTHQIGDVRSSLNHYESKNDDERVVTISRYVKSDDTDNVNNGFFELASIELLNFPAFSKFTISKKGKLIQRRGKRVHPLFKVA